MQEKFEDFIKNIPDDVTESSQEKEYGEGGPLDEGESLVHLLDVMEASENDAGLNESQKETQFGLLPRLGELVAELRKIQDTGGNNQRIQNAIVKLVAHEERIERMKS